MPVSHFSYILAVFDAVQYHWPHDKWAYLKIHFFAILSIDNRYLSEKITEFKI